MKSPDVPFSPPAAAETVPTAGASVAAPSSNNGHEVDAAAASKNDATPMRHLDRRYVTAALMLVMVLASMEMTVTSTAMPTIIGELHGLEHYSWVASIYLLASTVTMPLYGRLADTLGRKRVLLFSIVLFTAASVMASTAQSMVQLIIYRGIQGLGAGGVMPIVLTILGDIFTLKERARIQGFFSAVWGGAALGGPQLGAWLVTHFGWRSIFFINLPFALIAMVVLMRKYHDVEKPRKVDLDLPGIATLTIGCLSILALVSRLGPGGWSWQTSVALILVSAAACAYYVRHERLTEHPILPFEHIRDRAIGPSIFCTLLFGICFLALDTYVPLYVQGGHGGDANSAARVVTPVMLTWALSGPITAPLLVRWGFRKTALCGTVLIVIGFGGLLYCALTEPKHVKTLITCFLAITGFGFGPASMSYLLAAQDAVTFQHRGGVTATIGFFRSIGGSLGIGVMGTLFNILTLPQKTHLESLGVKPDSLLDPKELAKLSPEVQDQVRQMIAGSLTWVFAAMLLVAVAQVIVTTLMPKHRKAHHAPKMAEGIEAMG